VFRGERRDTGLVAAIKLQRDGPLAADRMRREIDTLAQLDHPNVMPIIEADHAARWYAMPLASCALRDLHDRAPSDWETLRRALQQTCAGLRYMHRHGFVHRDVSPGNVLQLDEDHWVIADHGLVKRPKGSSLTGTGMHFGTLQFSAPEVHHDPRTATPAADAYSIGALANWYTNITTRQEPDSEWGRFWSELICGALRFDPVRRWTMAQIAGHLARRPVAALVWAGHSPHMCARCGTHDGIDHAGRCIRCGFLDEV